MIKKVFTNAFINIICKISMEATKKNTTPVGRLLDNSWRTGFREGKIDNRGLVKVLIPEMTGDGQVGLAMTYAPKQGFYSAYFPRQVQPLKIRKSPDLVFASELLVEEPVYVSELPELRHYLFAVRYNKEERLYTLWTLDDHYTRQ